MLIYYKLKKNGLISDKFNTQLPKTEIRLKTVMLAMKTMVKTVQFVRNYTLKPVQFVKAQQVLSVSKVSSHRVWEAAVSFDY